MTKERLAAAFAIVGLGLLAWGSYLGLAVAPPDRYMGDVQRIMRHPLSTFQTDGDPVGYGEGFPHPRSYGAFPRILARYVRELGVLTLEEAIHKMTRLSMDRLGQTERGSIAEGMIADLVVFDPETIQDNADYVQPHQFSTGIETMIINGTLVIDGMALTGERPGTVLTRPETN